MMIENQRSRGTTTVFVPGPGKTPEGNAYFVRKEVPKVIKKKTTGSTPPPPDNPTPIKVPAQRPSIAPNLWNPNAPTIED